MHRSSWGRLLLKSLANSFVLLTEFLDDASNTFMELLWYLKGGELIDIEATLSLAEVHLVVQMASHDFLVLVRLKPLDALALFPQAELC